MRKSRIVKYLQGGGKLLSNLKFAGGERGPLQYEGPSRGNIVSVPPHWKGAVKGGGTR